MAMTRTARRMYNDGWNELVQAIGDWYIGGGNSEKWTGPRDFAADIAISAHQMIAVHLQMYGQSHPSWPYYTGVIDCAVAYLSNATTPRIRK